MLDDSLSMTTEKPKPRPKYCQADRDGKCTHPGCPQKKDWKPICPRPQYPEEE